MKYRTFTVLFIEEYDFVMTDDEAIVELRELIQSAYDSGYFSGNFLIVDVEDGDGRFWKEWKERSHAPS